MTYPDILQDVTKAVRAHAVELIQGHASFQPRGKVHLDIGGNLGAEAEQLRDGLGLEYVAVGQLDDSLRQLAERGFETHQTDLEARGTYDTLAKVIDGRTVASVSMLGGLETLAGGTSLLTAISRLVAEHRSVCVLSTPNATHMDRVVKGVLGTMQHATHNDLDTRPTRQFSAGALQAVLRSAGLSAIDTRDVVLAKSDQHFPSEHLGLSDATPFHQWLRRTRLGADPHALTTHFVWAVTSAPPRADPIAPPRDSGLFLTVVMRTQGRRSQELREALLCLSAQLSTDFEVLIIAHRTSDDDRRSIERVIDDQPESLRSRIRLLPLDSGQRAAPLNLALAEARGRYLTIFDDDDVVLGHWVQSFARAERSNQGRILRALSLCQDVTHAKVREVPGVRGLAAPRRIHSRQFSLTEHLHANQSPALSWAFPRSLYLDFGLKFDESMTTTEDWEFLLRSAELAGVTDLDEATSIYQWWKDRENSRSLHTHDEWRANQNEVERRVDATPLLLPAGESRHVRTALLRLKELERIVKLQDKQIARSSRRIKNLDTRITRLRTKRESAQRQLRVERRKNKRLLAQKRAVQEQLQSSLLRRIGRKLRWSLR